MASMTAVSSFENGARGLEMVEDGVTGHDLRADGDNVKGNVVQCGGALERVGGGVVAAVRYHDDGVHGLFGGLLGGAVEGGRRGPWTLAADCCWCARPCASSLPASGRT